MLDVVVKAGNLGAARALLEEMKAARLIDAASFNSMLNARGARTPLSVLPGPFEENWNLSGMAQNILKHLGY